VTDAYNAEDLEIEPRKRDAAALARRWNAEIIAAEKAQRKWFDRGQKVEKIYNDQRDVSSGRRSKFNILWSNVETQRPAVYLQTPKAQVGRRYRDKDPLARFASELLQRCLQTSCQLYDFDDAMDNAVRDRLLPGRGQCWIFYEPEFVGEELVYEKAVAGYVPWRDFIHSVARNWDEVWWVGRRFFKTRRQLRSWLKERGEDPNRAEMIKMDCAAEGDERREEGLQDQRAKAMIYEIWSKEDGEVIFIAPGSGEDGLLHIAEPPVQIEGFFPCPRPLLATCTSESLIPTPDYALYQDQAEEMNRITERIAVLQKALRVVGIFDESASDELIALFQDGGDNRMVPVKNWAMFQEGGGARGRVEWFPVEQVVEVLVRLYEARDVAKQVLYEVSGLSDIQRGATDPNETLGAQRIKAQWGTLRTRRLQKDVQRFARDLLNIKAEVISEVFQPETIYEMAGVDDEMIDKYLPARPMPPLPTPSPGMMMDPQAMQQAQAMQSQAQMAARQQFFMRAVELLRSSRRMFRIAVETDSTIEPDEQMERQSRIEILSAVGTWLEQAAPLMTQGPEAAKFAGELIKFGLRGFRKADQLEETVDAAIDAAAKQAAEPKPDPDAEKMKLEAEERKRNADREDARLKLDAQVKSKEVELKERELLLKEGDLLAAQEGVALQREAQMQDYALREREAEHRIMLGTEEARAHRELKRYEIDRRAEPKPAVSVNTDAEAAGSLLEPIVGALVQSAQAMSDSAEAMRAVAEAVGAEKELVVDPVTGTKRVRAVR